MHTHAHTCKHTYTHTHPHPQIGGGGSLWVFRPRRICEGHAGWDTEENWQDRDWEDAGDCLPATGQVQSSSSHQVLQQFTRLVLWC